MSQPLGGAIFVLVIGVDHLDRRFGGTLRWDTVAELALHLLDLGQSVKQLVLKDVDLIILDLLPLPIAAAQKIY